MAPARRPAAKRFYDKVSPEPNTGCWLWAGKGRHEFGYGYILPDGEKRPGAELAHRFSYRLHHGHIPDGMHVCHRCDVPDCVNPDHLFLGTAGDNVADMVEKKRFPFGEKHGLSKLNEDAIRHIRRKEMSGVGYAKIYSVTPSLICAVQKGRVWAHIQ